jgi:hypothetical protein
LTKGAFIIDNRLTNGELIKVIAAHAKFLPYDWDVNYISNEKIYCMADYNRLLTSKRFWRNMPDKVLIFQHDSALLRDGIEEFLNYGFIGAPIKHIPGCMNGGLSLRDKATMMKIIDNFPYMGEGVHGNEDIYFCNRLNWVGTNIPTKEQAAAFSVETEFALGSLGCHAIDKYLTIDQCDQIRRQYDTVEKR